MSSQRAVVQSLFVASALAACGTGLANAQETVRIGFSAPMSGPFSENGKQMSAALNLFIEQNGKTVAGKKIEVILRDDAGVPDQANRIARELVVNNKVAILAGYNPSPLAFAVAPISMEAKVPLVIMGASASNIPERSPYIV